MVSIQAHSGTKSSACAQPHADAAAHPSMYNSQKKKTHYQSIMLNLKKLHDCLASLNFNT